MINRHHKTHRISSYKARFREKKETTLSGENVISGNGPTEKSGGGKKKLVFTGKAGRSGARKNGGKKKPIRGPERGHGRGEGGKLLPDYKKGGDQWREKTRKKGGQR